MRTIIPLTASGIAIVSTIIVFVATWRHQASPLRARIGITILCVGICAMCIPRLLGSEGEDLALWRGVFVGCSFSAFLVSIMLPRGSTNSH